MVTALLNSFTFCDIWREQVKMPLVASEWYFLTMGKRFWTFLHLVTLHDSWHNPGLIQPCFLNKASYSKCFPRHEKMVSKKTNSWKSIISMLINDSLFIQKKKKTQKIRHLLAIVRNHSQNTLFSNRLLQCLLNLLNFCQKHGHS